MIHSTTINHNGLTYRAELATAGEWGSDNVDCTVSVRATSGDDDRWVRGFSASLALLLDSCCLFDGTDTEHRVDDSVINKIEAWALERGY